MQEQYQRSLTPQTIDYFESKWKTPYYLTKKMLKESPPISINEVQTHRRQQLTDEKENNISNAILNVQSDYFNCPPIDVFQQVEFLVKNIFQSIGIESNRNVKDLRIQLERALKRLENLIQSDVKQVNLNSSNVNELQQLKMKVNEYKNKLKHFSSDQKQEVSQLKKQLDSQKSIILMREEENAHLRRQFQDEKQKLEEIIEQLKRSYYDKRRDSYLDQNDYISLLQGQIDVLKLEKNNLINQIKHQNLNEPSNYQSQSNVIKDLQHRITDTNKQLQELTNYLMQQQRTESEQQHQLSDTIKKFEQKFNFYQESTGEDNDKKLQDLIEVNQLLQGQLLDSKKHLTELQQQLEMINSQNEELIRQNQLLSQNRNDEDSVFKLENIIQNLNERWIQCKNQLISEINKREIMENEYDDKIRGMTQKMEELNFKIQQKDLETEELKRNDQQLKNLQTKVKQQQNQFNNIKLQLIDKQNLLDNKIIELEKLKQQYSSLQSLYDEQLVEYKQLLDENTRKYNSMQMKELKNELSQKDRKYKQLQKRMKQEEENNNKFYEILQSLKQFTNQGNGQQEKQILISQLEFIKSQYEQLQKDFRELENSKSVESTALLEEELAQKNSKLQRCEIQILMLRQQISLQKGMGSQHSIDTDIIKLVSQLQQSISQIQNILQDTQLFETKHSEVINEINFYESSFCKLIITFYQSLISYIHQNKLFVAELIRQFNHKNFLIQGNKMKFILLILIKLLDICFYSKFLNFSSEIYFLFFF